MTQQSKTINLREFFTAYSCLWDISRLQLIDSLRKTSESILCETINQAIHLIDSFDEDNISKLKPIKVHLKEAAKLAIEPYDAIAIPLIEQRYDLNKQKLLAELLAEINMDKSLLEQIAKGWESNHKLFEQATAMSTIDPNQDEYTDARLKDILRIFHKLNGMKVML